MINTKALEILGKAIAEAAAIQADYIMVKPEVSKRITREQLAGSSLTCRGREREKMKLNELEQHLTDVLNTLTTNTDKGMSRGSFKRIGNRYLIRLTDGTYTGAETKTAARGKMRYKQCQIEKEIK